MSSDTAVSADEKDDMDSDQFEASFIDDTTDPTADFSHSEPKDSDMMAFYRSALDCLICFWFFLFYLDLYCRVLDEEYFHMSRYYPFNLCQNSSMPCLFINKLIKKQVLVINKVASFQILSLNRWM